MLSVFLSSSALRTMETSHKRMFTFALFAAGSCTKDNRNAISENRRGVSITIIQYYRRAIHDISTEYKYNIFSMNKLLNRSERKTLWKM